MSKKQNKTKKNVFPQLAKEAIVDLNSNQETSLAQKAFKSDSDQIKKI